MPHSAVWASGSTLVLPIPRALLSVSFREKGCSWSFSYTRLSLPRTTIRPSSHSPHPPPCPALSSPALPALEAKGVLGKIRAELRAAIFTAIDEQERSAGVHLANEEVQRMTQTPEGRLVTNLVREFLAFYDLDCTLSVFLPECDLDDYEFPDRARY